MSMLALDGSQIGIALLIVLFLIISVLMILVVLIQRPQGGGLSGAFGSSSEGAGQTAFGAKVGDALTTATILIFVIFLLSAVGLNLLIEAPKETPASVGPAGAGTTTEQTGDEAGTSTTPPAASAGETPGDAEPAPATGEPDTTPATDPASGDEPASDQPVTDQPTP